MPIGPHPLSEVRKNILSKSRKRRRKNCGRIRTKVVGAIEDLGRGPQTTKTGQHEWEPSVSISNCLRGIVGSLEAFQTAWRLPASSQHLNESRKDCGRFSFMEAKMTRGAWAWFTSSSWKCSYRGTDFYYRIWAFVWHHYITLSHVSKRRVQHCLQVIIASYQCLITLPTTIDSGCEFQFVKSLFFRGHGLSSVRGFCFESSQRLLLILRLWVKRGFLAQGRAYLARYLLSDQRENHTSP